MKGAQPWFVPGDVDGFFGLAIDNLIQFLLILGLCTGVLGFPITLVLGTILPGAAMSVLVGNVFYAWQAQKLSQKTGRKDVTALPYGINTVSLFAYVFLVMLPVKIAAERGGASPEEAARTAWQVGLYACVVCGLLEVAGAFVAEKIRKLTPRAALLSTLAGIAISFIAIDFAVRTFQAPFVALLPLAVILTTYFAGVPMPFRIPGGAWAIALGTAAAWIVWASGNHHAPVDPARIGEATSSIGFAVPIPVIGDLIAGATHPLANQFFVPVMLPMGLFNILGSLQNIESAEAAGDSYPTMPSLAVNGAGSVVAAAFGSCFPTTIYIGHPGWKQLGARSGYSILNGVFFTLVALFGLTSLISAIVPMEAGMAIVLWIGIVITAQAFQATPRAHAPAVAVGLFPAIAGWGMLILTQTLGAAGVVADSGKLPELLAGFARSGLQFPGLLALSHGFMITCMIWAATTASLIDRRFLPAVAWMAIGTVLSLFGFVHAGRFGPAGVEFDIRFGAGWEYAQSYAVCGVFFALMHVWAKRRGIAPSPAQDGPPPPDLAGGH